MSVTPKRDNYDVVVIGAGPAGLAAAAIAAEAGLSTLLLDENAGPGGQVWRAIASTPVTERDYLGADYWAGAALVDAVRSSSAEIIQCATVWSLDRNLEVGVSVGGASSFVKARRVILATGALERPFPIPGWTLPGVMTAGAAQTMLKSSGLVPDVRTVIAGQGPLLWLLAIEPHLREHVLGSCLRLRDLALFLKGSCYDAGGTGESARGDRCQRTRCRRRWPARSGDLRCRRPT